MHNAAFVYTGRYVQIQCLNHTEYNGLTGFVLGTLDNGRFAVLVPRLGFRLSLTCQKLRVLSIQEFEANFEWGWEPEHHIMVGEQKMLFKQENESSTADADRGSVLINKRSSD